jgi:hypothetical protein
MDDSRLSKRDIGARSHFVRERRGTLLVVAGDGEEERPMHQDANSAPTLLESTQQIE